MNKEITPLFDSALYDMFDELITYTTNEGRIIDCNKAFLDFVKKDKNKILNKKENKLLKQKKQEKEKISNEKITQYEEFVDFPKCNRVYFSTKKRLIIDKNHNCSAVLKIRKDVTQYRRNFLIYKEYKKLLKQMSNGKPLIKILKNLVKSVEKRDNDMICSILLLDKSEQYLFTAAAPSLPEFYINKLNGMKIGDKVGSCGAAVFLKERVIVEDISTHENWVLAKNLASEANLCACWSQPIISSQSQVLGTFAIYYNKPKKPTKFDLLLIKDIATIAGLAIEKYKNEYKINKNFENEKKQEQLLMHKSKQAMMGEMLENIAHQWRQPLSAITTSATGMQVKREMNVSNVEEENTALNDININAQYLSQTIEDFRHYFKSENKIVLFNIKDAFTHALKLIDARIKTDNIKIIQEIEDIEINSFENELTQVFMNILNNSIDELENCPDNSRFILIKIYEDKNNAIIKIIDSAYGANEDIVERIFEPYFTTKHQAQGTGIGLYMCKDIVEKHIEGTIEARNNIFVDNNNTYKGLEFVITIPIS